MEAAELSLRSPDSFALTGAGCPLGSFQPEALKGAFPLELPLWEGRQMSWCGMWQTRTWSWHPHPAVPGPSPANSHVMVQLCRGVLRCISGRPGDYSVSYLYTSINPMSLNHLEWILLLVVENWPLSILITFLLTQSCFWFLQFYSNIFSAFLSRDNVPCIQLNAI